MDSPARRSPAMPQDCVWFPSHDPIWISSHVFKIPIHKPKERGLVTKWVSFTPKFKRKEGQIYKLKGHKLGQRIATLLFNYFLLLFPFIWHLNDGSLKIESFFLLFIPRKSYPSPCLYITSTIWWFPIWYIQTASVISRFRHPAIRWISTLAYLRLLELSRLKVTWPWWLLPAGHANQTSGRSPLNQSTQQPPGPSCSP